MAKSIFQLKQEEELKKKAQSGEQIEIAKPKKMSSSAEKKWNESASKVAEASKGQVATSSYRKRQEQKKAKEQQAQKWYKGDKPTETEMLARIVTLGQQSESYGRKLYSDYERAKQEGHWQEKNAQANSRWLKSFGLESTTPEWMQANADLLQGAYYTATGVNPSSSKKGGAEGQMAYAYQQLAADEERTVKAEQAEADLMAEIKYLVGKGYGDDEIKAKIDLPNNKKYKAIYELTLDDGTLREITRPIQSATSYGVDGMIWAARNPNYSTGDYKMDAVQKELGHGKSEKIDPIAAAKRDRGNTAWSPYTNGTTMDDEAIRFGVTEFAPGWAEQHRAEILASGDEDAIKAFGKVYAAEEFTKQAEEEAETFRENVLRKIESGTPPEEIFKENFLDGYDALEKMYGDYMEGNPTSVTRSVDFDIAEYRQMAEAAYAKQQGAYSTDEYEANMADAAGGVHIPDEAKQKVNDGFNLDYNILLPQYAPIATTGERKAFRMIANAGYSDVVYVTNDLIVNGTGGQKQMNASVQKSAISFANENIASAFENMNLNVLPAADYLSDGTKDILTDMFPDIIAEGRVPTEDDYYAFMEQNFSTPDSLFSPERQLYEAAWIQTLGDRERAAAQEAGEEQKRADGQQLYESIKAEVAGAFGADTEDYRAVMATYEAAMPYARGVPRVWSAFDEYQIASGTEGMTPGGLNMILTNQRGQNARNIKFLQAQVNNFTELGLPQNFIDNAQQQLDDLIVQNELLGAHRLAENEDFASVGKAFDDAFGSTPPQFTQVSRDEMIRNAIMNPEAAIAFVNSQAGQQGAMSNFSELHEMAELATVMEPEELEIYKYKYGKEGPESATAYFEALSNNLAVRSAQEMSESVQEWAKQNEWTSAAATVGSVLLTPVEALGSLDAVLRMAMGEEVNWYDDSFLFSRTKSDLRTGTKEGFAEAYPDNKLAQSIYNTLYDAVTSAGDNLITAASGSSVAASAVMALSGMNSAMMDASMRGADNKHVVMYGLANAAVEFATEKMGMDNIIKAFSSGGADGVKGLISAVVENFGAEFGEEFASGILGTAVDDAIMLSMSNRDAAIAEYEAMGLTREEAEAQAAKDILTESLYGGLVGGISGGISAGIGYTGGWIKGNKEQNSEAAAPVEETSLEEGTEQQRATSLLATAASEDVGESQKAATTSSVLSTFGVVAEEATSASKKIVENGAVRKVLNLFKAATDPERISAAITMAANAAGSKCAAIMSENINPQNAVEYVGRLIEAYKEDRQNNAVVAEYDAAVTESMEADTTAQVLATMPPVDSSKKDAADEALRAGQEKADAAQAELQAANDAVAKSNERMKQNPKDPSLAQKLRSDIQKRAQAQKKAADANREVAKLKNAAKKAGIEFKTQTEKQLNEARAQAIEMVKQKRAEWEAAKAKAAEAELVLENEQPEAEDQPIAQEQTAADQQVVFDSAQEEAAPATESDTAVNEAVQPVAQNEAESPAVTVEPAIVRESEPSAPVAVPSQEAQPVESTAPAPQTPAPTPGKQGVSQFAAQTGQNTTVLSDGVKKQLRESPFYQKTNQKANVELAISNIESEGYETRRNKLLDGTVNLYTPEGQVEAYVLAKAAKDRGDAAGESAIAFKVKESGTLLGQSLAMRRMYVEMTPEGKAQFIQRIVDQINQDYANRKKDTRVKAPDWLADRLEQAAGDDEAVAKVLDDAYAAIAEQMPPDWKNRINAWRYTAMLANPRTHIRNIVGNLFFMPAVAVKNKIGAIAELTVDESQRTKSLGPVKKEYKEFAKTQLESVKDVLMGGGKHNPMDEIQSKRRTFNNNLLEWVVTKNGAALEAEDAFFLNRHFTNALAGFLQARNTDLSNVDKKTLHEGLDYAINEAQKATYRDASEIADKLSKFTRGLSSSKKRSAKAAGLLIEGALPFKKTPINVMRRGIEYSPVGLLSTLTVGIHDMHKGDLTRADFIDRFASGLTGTGLAAAGAWLASMGHLKLKLDEPEDELEKLSGAQEYSIELFGKSITIDWLSPSAMPLFVGGAVYDLMRGEEEEFNLNTVVDAILSIAKPVFNLSMLDGVNSMLSAASYGKNGVASVAMNAAESYASQFVPTILGAFARWIDPVRRTTYTDKNSGVPSSIQYLMDSTINKIPWLSRKGMPYLNAWGEEDVTSSGFHRFIENFVSPGYVNDLSPDEVEQALMELFDLTKEEGLLPKMPQKYFTVNKERKNLTAKEYEQLTRERGQTAHALHEQLFGNTAFLSMPAEYQVDAIEKVWEYSTQMAKKSVAPEFTPDAWVRNATSDPAQAIIEAVQSNMKSDRAKQMKAELYSAIDGGDIDMAAAYVEGIMEGGSDKKSIRSSVTSHYKPQYRELYESGDFVGLRELESNLILLNVGYKRSDFEKWLTKE